LIRLLLCILTLLPIEVSARERSVRTGDHVGFTRVFIPSSPNEKWNVSDRKREVRISIEQAKFDLSDVFSRITRDRIATVVIDQEELVLNLACDCMVSSFERPQGGVVVDILDRDPTAPAISLPLITREPVVDLRLIDFNRDQTNPPEKVPADTLPGVVFGERIEPATSERDQCLADDVLALPEGSSFSTNLARLRRDRDETGQAKINLAAFYALNGFFEEAQAILPEVPTEFSDATQVILTAISTASVPRQVAPEPLACLDSNSFWWLLMSHRRDEALVENFGQMPPFFQLRVMSSHSDLSEITLFEPQGQDGVFDHFAHHPYLQRNTGWPLRMAPAQVRESVRSLVEEAKPYDAETALLLGAIDPETPPDDLIIDWAIGSQDYFGALIYLAQSEPRILVDDMSDHCAKIAESALRDGDALDLLRTKSTRYPCGLVLEQTQRLELKLSQLGFPPAYGKAP